MPRLSPISYKQLVKSFKAEGFVMRPNRGRDHMVYTKRSVIRPVVIPKYAAAGIHYQKKSAGILRERYFELLGE